MGMTKCYIYKHIILLSILLANTLGNTMQKHGNCVFAEFINMAVNRLFHSIVE